MSELPDLPPDRSDPPATGDDPWAHLRRFTPARIGLGRSGVSATTREVLAFSLAHAQARDAIHLPLDTDALVAEVQAQGWSDVRVLQSRARSRHEYLLRPDLGRRLNPADAQALRPPQQAPDLVLVVGDGLSPLGIQRHAPALLAALREALDPALRLGPLVVVREARVAVGDEVGERLRAGMVAMLVGERLAEAFHAAGVPADVFQNVVLDHATTEHLIGARSFNFVNFTGSVGGGVSMEKAAAGTFTGLGLELGGKDPGYVRADADLDAAVDTLMDGAMYNAGQCCCGIERIYVHESLFDAFVEKAVTWVKGLTLGNPFDPASTLGPMANKRFAAVVRGQIAEAVAAGATPLIDPALFPADDGGAYLAPQILIDVNHSMRVMMEESFGPVVGIMKVKDDAEAIRLMNDSPYGLTASIWTQSPDVAAEIGARIETGTVFMNRADYLDPALCWTGCKDTGRGGSLSYLGFHSVTRPKSYHLKKVTK